MVAGYLLTGGKNSRMDGKNKFFLQLEGESFGKRILRAMSELSEVYLSVDREEPYLPLGIPLVKDEYDHIGPMGGILSGFHQLGEKALLVCACDTPFLTEEVVTLLRNAYQKNQILTLAAAYGSRQPLLGIYPPAAAPVMEQLVEQGDYRMKNVTALLPYQLVELPNPETAANINSVCEYEKIMEKRISLEDAVKLLLEYAERKLNRKSNIKSNGRDVLIRDALGAVLDVDIYSPVDQPPFPRSPLDGYALRGEDTIGATAKDAVSLHVIGRTFAGEVYEGRLQQGEALRIMTGAPIPAGANTVVRQEDTLLQDGSVAICCESKPYSNYCPQGEDFKKGELLLTKGTCLGSAEIALLAAMGESRVPIRQKASVAFFSTGDELIRPGEAIMPGKIYDSNYYYGTSRLREWGVDILTADHLPDDPDKVAEAIRCASNQADLIITTGGVSVGEKDIMHDVERQLKAKHLFWKVKVKPGSPVLAFVYEHTLVICLSGNPCGVMVHMELLARPVLEKLTGNPKLALKAVETIMADSYENKKGMRRYLRGYFDGNEVDTKRFNQKAGAVSGMIGCNCFVEIPENCDKMEKGDRVWIYLL